MMTAVQSPMVDELARRSLLTGAAAVGIGVLAGCGAGDARDDGPAANGFPRTVEHAEGTTEVPSAPRRVVSALDYNDLDAVLAVGVVPVAYGFSPWLVPDLTPWAGAASAGTKLPGPIAEISLEAVAAQTPDLIVVQADLLAGKLDQLQAIAPTVAVGVRDGDWRTGTTVVGPATGREAQAAVAIDRAETETARARDELAGLRGARVGVLSRYSGRIRVDSIADGRAGSSALLRDLGLVPADVGLRSIMDTLSDEELSRFADVDALLLHDFVAGETEQLLALPVFRRLAVVRERRVARLSPAATRAMYLPSATAVPYAVRQMVPALLAARAGTGSTAPVPNTP